MEQQPLFDKYQLVKDWRSAENQIVRETACDPSPALDTKRGAAGQIEHRVETIFAAISDYAPILPSAQPALAGICRCAFAQVPLG